MLNICSWITRFVVKITAKSKDVGVTKWHITSTSWLIWFRSARRSAANLTSWPFCEWPSLIWSRFEVRKLKTYRLIGRMVIWVGCFQAREIRIQMVLINRLFWRTKNWNILYWKWVTLLAATFHTTCLCTIRKWVLGRQRFSIYHCLRFRPSYVRRWFHLSRSQYDAGTRILPNFLNKSLGTIETIFPIFRTIGLTGVYLIWFTQMTSIKFGTNSRRRMETL